MKRTGGIEDSVFVLSILTQAQDPGNSGGEVSPRPNVFWPRTGRSLALWPRRTSNPVFRGPPYTNAGANLKSWNGTMRPEPVRFRSINLTLHHGVRNSGIPRPRDSAVLAAPSLAPLGSFRGYELAPGQLT